jgi:hypothetical protein
MQAHSVQTLVQLVRTRTGNLNSATFDDTTELRPWIRQSMAQLYEILCSRYLDFYTVTRPMSLNRGQTSYSLPSDFRLLGAVYMIYANTGNPVSPPFKRKLEPATPGEAGQYAYFNGSINLWPCKYELLRQQICFYPAPSSDMTNVVEFRYTPTFNPPLLDYTPVDRTLPYGWDEWVVLDVIQKMRGKMNMDVEDLLKQKSEVISRIIAAASVRTDDAPQMTDIWDSRYNYNSWLMGVPVGPAYWTSS